MTAKWTLRRIADEALTAADHQRLTADRQRPITDRPVGANTSQRREHDAQASAVFTDDTSADRLGDLVAHRQHRNRLCGTVAGWDNHQALREAPCPACRTARARARRNAPERTL